MPDVDLSRLPTGELGWLELIGSVIESDDRVERYFLEVKSEIDVNVKAGRAKVAKFILGAANRDPVLARRRFGGHALMVLGIGEGRVVGVPSFEAKDLAGAIQKWIGVGGPGWDFERIRIGEHDVIVIVVDPPTGDLWTCRGDGDGLVDGGIYVRHDGETRRATGDEVRLLVERATRRGSRVDIDVVVDGDVKAIQVDASVLSEYVENVAASLRGQVDRRLSGGLYGLSALAISDRRSREEFLDQVAAWERESLESLMGGVIKLAARVHDGISVRLRNLTRTFLRDVRLDLMVEGDVLAADWERIDKSDLIELFPTRPRDWGSESLIVGLTTMQHFSSNVTRAQQVHGVVCIKREAPAMLTMHMNALRPEEEHPSDNDEVVLIMFSDAPPETVTARWRVTAQDINDVFEGTLEIPVIALDWRDAIAELLHGDEEEDPDADR